MICSGLLLWADMRAPARACQREHQCGEHQHHTLYYIIQAIGYQNSLKENKSDIIYSGSSLFGRQVYHKHYLLYIYYDRCFQGYSNTME